MTRNRDGATRSWRSASRGASRSRTIARCRAAHLNSAQRTWFLTCSVCSSPAIGWVRRISWATRPSPAATPRRSPRYDHDSPRGFRVNALEEFTQLRPRLFGIAYRMTGSVADADDICQDAWLRWTAVNSNEVNSAEA